MRSAPPRHSGESTACRYVIVIVAVSLCVVLAIQWVRILGADPRQNVKALHSFAKHATTEGPAKLVSRPPQPHSTKSAADVAATSGPCPCPSACIDFSCKLRKNRPDLRFIRCKNCTLMQDGSCGSVQSPETTQCASHVAEVERLVGEVSECLQSQPQAAPSAPFSVVRDALSGKKTVCDVGWRQERCNQKKDGVWTIVANTISILQSKSPEETLDYDIVDFGVVDPIFDVRMAAIAGRRGTHGVNPATRMHIHAFAMQSSKENALHLAVCLGRLKDVVSILPFRFTHKAIDPAPLDFNRVHSRTVYPGHVILRLEAPGYEAQLQRELTATINTYRPPLIITHAYPGKPTKDLGKWLLPMGYHLFHERGLPSCNR